MKNSKTLIRRNDPDFGVLYKFFVQQHIPLKPSFYRILNNKEVIFVFDYLSNGVDLDKDFTEDQYKELLLTLNDVGFSRLINFRDNEGDINRLLYAWYVYPIDLKQSYKIIKFQKVFNPRVVLYLRSNNYKVLFDVVDDLLPVIKKRIKEFISMLNRVYSLYGKSKIINKDGFAMQSTDLNFKGFSSYIDLSKTGGAGKVSSLSELSKKLGNLLKTSIKSVKSNGKKELRIVFNPPTGGGSDKSENDVYLKLDAYADALKEDFEAFNDWWLVYIEDLDAAGESKLGKGKLVGKLYAFSYNLSFVLPKNTSLKSWVKKGEFNPYVELNIKSHVRNIDSFFKNVDEISAKLKKVVLKFMEDYLEETKSLKENYDSLLEDYTKTHKKEVPKKDESKKDESKEEAKKE